MSESISHDFLFNIVVTGSLETQVDSLIHAFTGPDSNQTSSHEMNGKLIKTQFWNTSGVTERFKTLMPSYYRNAQGAVLVYDSSDSKSFQNIPKLLQDLRDFSDPSTIVMLVGIENKSEPEPESPVTVPSTEAEEYAQQNGLKFAQIDLVDSENIEKAFHTLICDIFEVASKKPALDKPVIPKLGPNYDLLFQLIILGDTEVGKANLVSRFVSGDFRSESKGRVGVELSQRSIQLDNKIIRARFWNTNPSERHKEIRAPYYGLIVGAILVYDITKYETFQSVDKWLRELRYKADDDIVILMIGNKVDLEELRQVTVEEAEEFATEQNLLFIETSAKETTNVEKAFQSVLTDIYYKIESSNALNEPAVFTKQNILPKLPTKTKAPPKKGSPCKIN